MKVIKKTYNIFFRLIMITVFLIPFFSSPYIVEADVEQGNMTIKELQEKINKDKENLNKTNQQITLTNEEITRIKNNINLIGKQMEESNANVVRLKKEIEELNVKIEEKDKEIKKVINYLQISSGESEYMEYIFGAKDFTDFIYRMAITEQITDYNDKLVKEYNQMIENNKKKQEEEKVAIEQLKKKQTEANLAAAKLETTASRLNSDKGSIAKGLEATQAILTSLKSMGCGDDETPTACSMRVYKFPVSSAGMIRPVSTGFVSSEFGPRWGTIHGGIDIAVPTGTPVYAVASGIVTDAREYGIPGTGTGLTIHIRHIVNGKYYTSCYQHLSQYKVSIGQTVHQGQVIALSGNTGFSTGPHLHFALFYGWAGLDYGIWDRNYYSNGTYYSVYENMWFNPRFMINF